MSVERWQTERIAALARLHFESDELGRLTEELNRILAHVEALKSLEAETADRVEAGGSSGARDPRDAPLPSTRGPEADLPDELHLDPASLSPEWSDGFFVVPPLPGVRERESE